MALGVTISKVMSHFMMWTNSDTALFRGKEELQTSVNLTIYAKVGTVIQLFFKGILLDQYWR